jgi:ABC-type transport system involved in multi-copper enzyme maturation permease subunit
MSDETLRQAIIDEEHLKLLSIGYLVSAGVAALFSLFGLLYVIMGVTMGIIFSEAAKKANESSPPAFIGWVFGIVGIVIFLLLIAMALLKFQTARCIKRRRSRAFCMVVGAISCLEIPYGTLLGVFTFLVLGRNSVKGLFEPQTASSPLV